MKNKYRIPNKEPQNDEVFNSKFDISCSTFCGSKERSNILTLIYIFFAGS